MVVWVGDPGADDRKGFILPFVDQAANAEFPGEMRGDRLQEIECGFEMARIFCGDILVDGEKRPAGKAGAFRRRKAGVQNVCCRLEVTGQMAAQRFGNALAALHEFQVVERGQHFGQERATVEAIPGPRHGIGRIAGGVRANQVFQGFRHQCSSRPGCYGWSLSR
jgi:hypothetical protein